MTDIRVVIKSFPKRAVLNPGGLSAFYFIPLSQVLSIPSQSKGRICAPLKLTDHAHWLAGYATSESLKYGEKSNKTPNGTYYSVSLQGSYPGDPAEVQSLFTELESQGVFFLVVFVDLLGRRRLAGYGGALAFESDYDSENKRYTFSFSGESLERAPIYPFEMLF